jgi:hypothetical protein
MKSLGLTYRVSADENSSKHRNVPHMQLDPPIDRVAAYEGLITSQDQRRREISPSVSASWSSFLPRRSNAI